MLQRIVYFLALLLTALALAPAMAHLLELPNKIGLGRDEYFLVQNIYRGWSLIGFVILPALVATLLLPFLIRHRRRACASAAAGFVALAASHALFWVFTQPANVATRNWTVAPANWRALRDQWEYSHAAAAVFTLIALAALIVSVLSWAGDRASRRNHTLAPA